MQCVHLWLKRGAKYVCSKCGETFDSIDAGINGDYDWRDDETWKDFSEPIRRNYIRMKEQEKSKVTEPD